MTNERLSPVAVLDANVIYPMVLTDVLLTLAQAGFYRPLWSEMILAEAQSHVSQRYPDMKLGQINRRFEQMKRVFPSALFSDESASGQLGLPDPDDEHVVATAINARADLIVTNNIKDFPAELLTPAGLIALPPGQFLVMLYRAAPDIFTAKLRALAVTKTHPRLTLTLLLDYLAAAGAPELKQAMKDQ